MPVSERSRGGPLAGEPDAHFILQDYEETFWDDCQIIFTTRRSVALLSSSARVVDFINTRWHSSSGDILSDNERELISNWCSSLWKDLEMSCDTDGMLLQLTAIADAQTAINAKTPSLLTWSEFIDDLGNSTLSDIVPFVELFTALSDLIPNIEIRLSPADWIKMIADILFKRKVTNALDKIARNTGISNWIEGGETVAQGIETVDEIIDTGLDLGNILVGGLSGSAALVSALTALYALYQSSGSDPDPDSNPDLRSAVRIANNINIVNQLGDMCCDYSGVTAGLNTSDIITGTPSTPGGVGDIPFSNEYAWGSATTENQRCQAAKGITDGLYLFFNHGSWDELASAGIGVLTGTAISSALLIIGVSVSGLVLIPLTAVVAMLGTFLAIGFALGGTSIFTLISDAINANRTDLECSLFDATTTGGARAGFISTIEAAGLNPLLSPLVKIMLADDTLGALFYTNPNLDYSSYSVDCSGCETSECPEFAVVRGVNTSGNNWQSEFDTPSGLYYVDMCANATDCTYNSEDHCGTEITLQISNLSGWTNPGAGNNFAVRNSNGGVVYNHQSQIWPGSSCGRYFQIKSSTNFSVTLTPGGC